MCRPWTLIWPEKELEGKEGIYYASTEYIRQQMILNELLLKIPKVPVKSANHAEIKRLKRKAEALRIVSHV